MNSILCTVYFYLLSETMSNHQRLDTDSLSMPDTQQSSRGTVYSASILLVPGPDDRTWLLKVLGNKIILCGLLS